MFFSFPEDARWNEDRNAVEFGVEIGEYAGVAVSLAASSSTYWSRAQRPRSASRATTSIEPGSSLSLSASSAVAS
jgi:hypothetical protein